MKLPTRADVISYAQQLGVSPTVGATYFEFGNSNSWIMHDNTPVENWQTCFRLWVERMQGRPGFEITLHDKPDHKRSSQSESQLLKRDRIIMTGRKKRASDEQIGVVLAKYGLSW